jgi:hypothetical protein
MYQIIAPILFQNKICRLPGIGTLVMVAHSATPDFVNTRIKSPTETIDFIQETNNEKVFNEFTAMSELLLQHLNENNSFLLKGVGTFTKNETGEIRFAPIAMNPIFTRPVVAERLIRQDEVHTMLVGNQYTNNVEMTEYFSEHPPILKSQWWVSAIVLASIGILVLIWYLSQKGVNMFGNISGL